MRAAGRLNPPRELSETLTPKFAGGVWVISSNFFIAMPDLPVDVDDQNPGVPGCENLRCRTTGQPDRAWQREISWGLASPPAEPAETETCEQQAGEASASDGAGNWGRPVWREYREVAKARIQAPAARGVPLKACNNRLLGREPKITTVQTQKYTSRQCRPLFQSLHS